MSQLEVKKIMAEIWRCHAARFEQDHKIEERLSEIDRLKEAMKTQTAHIEKLKQQLTDMGVSPPAI